VTDPTLTRYRLAFGKSQAMRYTGHLDLYRALERTIRRAALPLAYSRGFSPHPKLQLAAALPLGMTSHAELADIWLEHPVPEVEILERLQQASPPGIAVERVRQVPTPEPPLQRQVQRADFVARLETPLSPDLARRLEALLEATSLPRERRGKAYDLRPLIIGIRLAPPAEILLSLSAREGATGRPEEALDALGLDPLAADLTRVQLTLDPSPAAAPAARTQPAPTADAGS
jgi:radical SAM-linked protein